MISNIHKNIMGTTSFDGQFSGMRKPQEFIVYPINSEATSIQIQSDTRFGYIEISTGVCTLSASHAGGGAYAFHYAKDCHMGKAKQDTIPDDELRALLNFIRGTSSAMAGNNGMRVFVDNSQAHNI